MFIRMIYKNRVVCEKDVSVVPNVQELISFTSKTSEGKIISKPFRVINRTFVYPDPTPPEGNTNYDIGPEIIVLHLITQNDYEQVINAKNNKSENNTESEKPSESENTPEQ